MPEHNFVPFFAAGMKNLLPFDGEAYLDPGFLQQSEADGLFAKLFETLNWKHETISMFGRAILQPRLTAFVGDPGVTYTYSRTKHVAEPWPPAILFLREKLVRYWHDLFLNYPGEMPCWSSALINLYRNGQDSMGFHRDNEPELGPQPCIASVNLGAARTFVLKHLATRDTVRCSLSSGSLLVLGGQCQEKWEHGVPKELKSQEKRINITFRAILKSG